MNIFHLDKILKLCAHYHCDKHVVKMILEYAQMLSTAHRMLDCIDIIKEESKNNMMVKRFVLHDKNLDFLLYKASHINHPCNIWVRESAGNYNYLYELFVYLNEEFTYRYGSIHSTFTKLNDYLKFLPKNILLDNQTNYFAIPLCMPDEYKEKSYIESYRNFYIYGKSQKFNLTWKKRDVPEWYFEIDSNG